MNIPSSFWTMDPFRELAKAFWRTAVIFAVLITVSASPGVLAFKTAKHILFTTSRISFDASLPLSFKKERERKG